MTHSRRTQLVLIAAGTLILAIAATAWWLSSPQGVRRAGEATVLLVGALCGLGHIRQSRRLPWRSPLILYTTVVGGVLLVERPAGPLVPIALWVLVALAWAWFAARDRLALRNTENRVPAGGRWITSSR